MVSMQLLERKSQEDFCIPGDAGRDSSWWLCSVKPSRLTVRRTVRFCGSRLSRYKNNPNPQMWFGLFFFGANVLLGLFEKCARTNGFSESDIFRFHPHPSGMRLKSEGLSHALQNSPPDCFVPSLCSGRDFESHLSRKQKYLQIPNGIWRYLGITNRFNRVP